MRYAEGINPQDTALLHLETILIKVSGQSDVVESYTLGCGGEPEVKAAQAMSTAEAEAEIDPGRRGDTFLVLTLKLC